jgi:hypothetical protein
MKEEVVYKKILRYTRSVTAIDLGRYLGRVIIKLVGLKMLRVNGEGAATVTTWC